MTEHEAIITAFGELKVHGVTRDELNARLPFNAEKQVTTVQIMETCRSLLQERGHAHCAEFIERLTWDPPS